MAGTKPARAQDDDGEKQARAKKQKVAAKKPARAEEDDGEDDEDGDGTEDADEKKDEEEDEKLKNECLDLARRCATTLLKFDDPGRLFQPTKTMEGMASSLDKMQKQLCDDPTHLLFFECTHVLLLIVIIIHILLIRLIII